mmetsp:Transcript_82893/g.146483  ORF Transcript_82893/g.146483 Transcript_82893/m.146483 type:complete len:170 (+) Transcript_82893:67-576(+)
MPHSKARRSFLLAGILFGFLGLCRYSELAKVPSPDTWIDAHTTAEAALKEAAGMVSAAQAKLNKIKMSSEQTPSTRDQENLSEAWLQFEKARVKYRIAAEHMQEARDRLSAELKEMTKQAKKQFKEVPAELKAQLEAFIEQMDFQIKEIQDRLQPLNAALDAARGAVAK